MKTLLKGGSIFSHGKISKQDILIDKGVIVQISPDIPVSESYNTIILNDIHIFPGFVDVHTHLREPGFSYKETIATGTAAAAHGGITSICAMPNLNPVPDCRKSLDEQLKIIKKDALVNVYPYAAITVNEHGQKLAEMEQTAKYAIAFSDDGHGVQDENIMRQAMTKAKSLGKIIAAHCEENSLLNGGYIHKGEYAALHSHKGICSESEWVPIKRDIALAEETGCSYHICHISTKESVELIRQAKARGVKVTCETAPHYLCFNDMDLIDEGRFKMNPPIRSEADRRALIEGIKDGTIDLIATDHAPHSAEEKSKGLQNSAMGVVGLETSFAVMYTKLVKPGIISLEKLIKLMNSNARKIFGIGTEIEIGQSADLAAFDLNGKYTVNPDDFLSKGRATPFEGLQVYGKCKLCLVGGKTVWQEKK